MSFSVGLGPMQLGHLLMLSKHAEGCHIYGLFAYKMWTKLKTFSTSCICPGAYTSMSGSGFHKTASRKA